MYLVSRPPRINHVNWIISTVDKHIVAQDALARRGVGIRIEESADFGIVITGL